MPKFIDARGKICPMPVIMAKKEIDAGEQSLSVAVDNEIAVGNLMRLANSFGIEARSEKIDDNNFIVVFADGATEEIKLIHAPVCTSDGCGYGVFFGKDYVGEGDYILGHNLAKMMLYTLSESDDIPAAIIFMNSGIKLPAGDEEDIISSISVLMEKGTEVLVCGTCINYYNMAERLKVGTVSNMFEIIEKIKQLSKIIYA